MPNGKKFKCDKCGEEVAWLTNKAGNRYLGEYRTYGRRFPHYHHSDKDVEAYLGFRQAEIDRGEIVKGQTVEVFKGRKVPKGTTGIVFWVSPDEDSYGVVKIGLKTEAGEPHFTNIANVRSIKEGITT